MADEAASPRRARASARDARRAQRAARPCGSKDQLTRANKKRKTLLAEYKPPELDSATDERLQDYIQRRRATMPDDIA